MALVGVAYSLLLRHTWNPHGWQLVADEALHDVMPVLVLVYWWLAVPRAALRPRDVVPWCAYPVAYFLYAAYSAST